MRDAKQVVDVEKKVSDATQKAQAIQQAIEHVRQCDFNRRWCNNNWHEHSVAVDIVSPSLGQNANRGYCQSFQEISEATARAIHALLLVDLESQAAELDAKVEEAIKELTVAGLAK